MPLADPGSTPGRPGGGDLGDLLHLRGQHAVVDQEYAGAEAGASCPVVTRVTMPEVAPFDPGGRHQPRIKQLQRPL